MAASKRLLLMVANRMELDSCFAFATRFMDAQRLIFHPHIAAADVDDVAVLLKSFYDSNFMGISSNGRMKWKCFLMKA